MRRMIVMSFLALLAASTANDGYAQHRGGAGPAFGRGGFGFNRARVMSHHRFSYAYLPYGFGYGYPSYDSGAAYYEPPQPIVIVQQPPMIDEPPEPPVVKPVGHSVITEYKWPATKTASSSSAAKTAPEPEPQTFAIVLKDGSTLSAMSVFASDDGLHYVDPDERHMGISMSMVDRAATLKLNRSRNLDLYLPAAR